MKIIILGYTGLIGKSILKNLFNNTSFDLVCVGRKVEKNLLNNSRITYIKWDFIKFKKSNLKFFRNSNVIINCVGKTNNKLEDFEYINNIFLKKLFKFLSDLKQKVRFINLSSVSVYGGVQNYIGKNIVIDESSKIYADCVYSKSKLKSEQLTTKKLNKNFSYTILRISNVFGDKKNSNLYNFVLLLLKNGIWIKSSNNVVYNFVNVNDVSQSVNLVISNLDISKNKIYIVSDDIKQFEIYKTYQKIKKEKIILTIPIKFVKFIINLFPLPKKILNFFLLISSEVSYSNKKIKKELNFKPSFSLKKEIAKLNG